jgi:hypothetical protein
MRCLTITGAEFEFLRGYSEGGDSQIDLSRSSAKVIRYNHELTTEP